MKTEILGIIMVWFDCDEYKLNYMNQSIINSKIIQNTKKIIDEM